MINPEHIIISYDIDGTVVAGDPPGRISMAMIQETKDLGYIIGSASDRTLTDQTQIWNKNSIDMEFIVLKHTLPDLVKKYDHVLGFHIGDTNMDEFYAKQAGLIFIDIINGDFDTFWNNVVKCSFQA